MFPSFTDNNARGIEVMHTCFPLLQIIWAHSLSASLSLARRPCLPWSTPYPRLSVSLGGHVYHGHTPYPRLSVSLGGHGYHGHTPYPRLAVPLEGHDLHGITSTSIDVSTGDIEVMHTCFPLLQIITLEA
jgi:hypothetical protein